MTEYSAEEWTLINSWKGLAEHEQFLALTRLQFNPRSQRLMQEAIEMRRKVVHDRERKGKGVEPTVSAS